MNNAFLYQFISHNKFGVIASINSDISPEAALVGIAVTPDLRIIFDTVTDSRKYHNIVANPKVAIVVGWDDERTLQYEGVAYIPEGKELEELQKVYFRAFRDGRQRATDWPNIVLFCVTPKWIRYTDYSRPKTSIEELNF